MRQVQLDPQRGWRQPQSHGRAEAARTTWGINQGHLAAPQDPLPPSGAITAQELPLPGLRSNYPS